MIISHTNRFILIKSVKTAGTSVEAALSNVCNGNDVVTPLNDFRFNRDENGNWIHRPMNADEFREIGQHVDASEIKRRLPPETWDGYYKISLARNPWDRVVSLFTWKARKDPMLQPHKKFYHRLGLPFDEFEETRRRFSRFVTGGDWQTNDCFYLVDGELCVDYVIRYESLVNDFKEICRRVGLPEMALPRLKTGIRPSQYHYSEYYDEDSKAVVAERHSNDLRLFHYSFERS